MKNTIKTLVVFAGIVQGTAVLADDVLINSRGSLGQYQVRGDRAMKCYPRMISKNGRAICTFPEPTHTMEIFSGRGRNRQSCKILIKDNVVKAERSSGCRKIVARIKNNTVNLK
jgi:hypothetical protein